MDYLSDQVGVGTLALVAAAGAFSQEEIPVGAVLQDRLGRILAEAGNCSIASRDPTGHGELRAIRLGARRLNNYRLLGSCLVVTIAPCGMCQGGIVQARVDRTVYLAPGPEPHPIQEGLQPMDNSDLAEGNLNLRLQPMDNPDLAEGALALMRAFFVGKREPWAT